ncbi:MAG: glucose dehydrogenase [Dehalococcoidia bacterium]|nr:glucose dehydrogenase [Dehalococcoidia bacterium]
MSAGPWRRSTLAAGLLVAAALVACGDSSPAGRPSPPATPISEEATPSPTGTSVAGTPEPSPAPRPHTSTPAADEEPAFALVPAFPGLPEYERFIDLIDVPEHDLFLIVLQKGRVLSVDRDGPYDEPRTVLDHREATVCCGEQGLLSIALDPDFAANGYVYAHYNPSAEPGRTWLSRFETTGGGGALVIDPESELVLLRVRQPFTNHNGGTVLFGPDGMLYLGLGDGGAADDPYGHGQDFATYLGSIIRIDVRGASPERPYDIPSDNPFLEDDGALPETWAYGLRNPWRMSFDRETGLLWAADVGQNRIEEISIIEAGGNYGWNIMEGSRCFLPETGCDRTGLVLPVWEYSHDDGCSITGGFVYRGQAVPELYGWYVYSDFCSDRIWAIDAETAATGGFVAPIVLWEGEPALVVSFAEDRDGELYVISFDGEGIYRVVAR